MCCLTLACLVTRVIHLIASYIMAEYYSGVGCRPGIRSAKDMIVAIIMLCYLLYAVPKSVRSAFAALDVPVE